MKRASKQSSPKEKKLGRPLPRSLTHRLVAEAVKELDDQLLTAEFILSVVGPTGKTLWGSFPILKVIELAVDAHIRKLYQVRQRLAMIVDREGVKLPDRLRFDQREAAP